MNAEKYNGHWILLPELSIYQSGEPPLSGQYVIRSVESIVEFEIEWIDASRERHKIGFSGPVDGEKHDSESPGITSVIYEKIDESILDSTAFSEDKILMYARRAASLSGDLLAVFQVIHGEEGKLSNFQVYQRKGT